MTGRGAFRTPRAHFDFRPNIDPVYRLMNYPADFGEFVRSRPVRRYPDFPTRNVGVSVGVGDFIVSICIRNHQLRRAIGVLLAPVASPAMSGDVQ